MFLVLYLCFGPSPYKAGTLWKNFKTGHAALFFCSPIMMVPKLLGGESKSGPKKYPAKQTIGASAALSKLLLFHSFCLDLIFFLFCYYLMALMSMMPWKKTLTIPSLSMNDHCYALGWDMYVSSLSQH